MSKSVTKFFSQIRKMEGKTFRINGSTVDEHIRTVTISNEDGPDEILIQTSIRLRRISDIEQAEKFIKDAVEVPADTSLVKNDISTELLLPEKEQHELDNLESILMGQIAKIDKNERYVKQAREINITVKNIIGIKTMKLRAAEMILRAKKKASKGNGDEF